MREKYKYRVQALSLEVQRLLQSSSKAYYFKQNLQKITEFMRMTLTEEFPFLPSARALLSTILGAHFNSCSGSRRPYRAGLVCRKQLHLQLLKDQAEANQG